jgi:hypothetical protein
LKPSADLNEACDVIARVVARTSTGTQADPGHTTRIDLALSRAEDRAGGRLPRDGDRGGSSTPSEADERKERDAVCRQAELDYHELGRLVGVVKSAAHTLERIVNRQAEVVHESKLPADGPLPGCVSCARFGHFEKVDERRPSFRLCKWCRDVQVHYGQLPPREAIDLRHSSGPTAGGQWLARDPVFRALAVVVEQRRLEEKLTEPDELPRCPNIYTHLGADYRCVRPVGHGPGCRAVLDGASVEFPVSV